MQDTEAQEIITQLIQQAIEVPPLEFQPITTWSEYFYHVGQKKALKAVTKVLKISADSALKSYCSGVTEGCANFAELLAHVQLADVYAYYKHELKITVDMINDFEDYTIKGGFIKMLLGIPREV